MPDLAHALPLTGRRMAGRLTSVSPLVMVAAGAAFAVGAGRRSAGTAFLSLGLPGLGQLVQGRVLAGVALLVLTLVAVVLAMVRSAGVLLLFVAAVAGLDAALGGSWWAVPAGIALATFVAAAIGQYNLARRRSHARTFEAARAGFVAATDPSHLRSVSAASPPPLDQFGEAYLRYLMAFGHAAPDDWSVFDDPKHVDSALRYQMVLAAWSLYLFQNQHTPAYREAVSTALGNVAERGRDHRVWGYTKATNLRAMRVDGDPFARENVMYSGYMADVVSMYEAISGDHRYDAPGGYSVSDGRRTYAWNHRDIVDNLAVQHATSPMGAITCLPGWVWPPCQTFSLRAIQLGDLVHGTDHSWAVERWREAFSKFFIDADGHIDTCRQVAGFVHPIDAFIVGISGQAGTGVFTSSFGRELVERNYELQVKSRMEPADEQGRIRLRLGKMDTYDTSYGWNPGMPYSIALLYAREIGDVDAAEGLRRTLEEMLTPDAVRPGPGSILSMALTFMALVDSERGLAAAHRHAPANDSTPELRSAPWPQVMVTAAHTDGAGVTCEVVPGPAENTGNVELSFARLRPRGAYAVSGTATPETLEADDAGELKVKVDPAARTHVVVAPV